MVYMVKYKQTGDCPWSGADVLVGQLSVDQLVMRATRRTPLGVSLMKPEPHDDSVVLLTCGDSERQPPLINPSHDHWVTLNSLP